MQPPSLQSTARAWLLRTPLGDPLRAAKRAVLAARGQRPPSEPQGARGYLAQRYLRGNGIEIGAAHMPLQAPPGAHVSYLDIFPAEQLKVHFPGVADFELVEVDILDDGERLEKVGHATQDFVIANHFLEHCLDPIGTLINIHDRLAPGGVLFMAIPDMRRTFDRHRPITPYEHLLDEHRDDGARSFLREHTEEYVRLAEMHTGDIAARAQELIDSGYRIHYHVWTYAEIHELFTRAIGDFELALEIEACVVEGNEVIVVARKAPPGEPPQPAS